MSEAENLVAQVGQSITDRKLLRRGESVLVGVSGGLDSMVLLDLLACLAEGQGWKLTGAHFNHQLRGRSSDADERLVRRVANKMRLPFACGRGDVRQFAREQKLSLEMAARKLRHEFFAREASRRKIRRIALAHHADDQVELFFLRLLRGAGGEALSGMKWQGPSPADPKIQISRPLLAQPKSALAAYAKEMRVPFREDATNAQLDIQRNRIRHELIPLLREHHQPALERVILRQMEVLGGESEFVTQTAQDWLENREPIFDKLPVAIQRRCIQLQFAEHGFALGFGMIEELRLAPNRPVTVSFLQLSNPQAIGQKAFRIFRDESGTLHVSSAAKPSFVESELNVRLEGKRGKITFEKVQIRWEIVPLGTVRAHSKSVNCEKFDAAKIGSNIVLRHWQPGDRFQPIGMAKPVKLQDFFTNEKVPRAKRHELLVAATDKGEIFWVEGVRISDRFKLDKTTQHGLKWGWKRVE